jgi:hypothetical protein
MDTAIKALLLISLLGLAGCGGYITPSLSVGVGVTPAPYYGGGDYYGPRWGRWHRRGWW